jgi:type I restriction enzyme S subunit
MSAWQTVNLGVIVAPVERGEIPIPGNAYRQIGVKLWGEGAYERETLDGAQTRYTQLFRAEAGDIIVNKIWARNGSVAVVPSSLAGCFGSGEFPMFAPNRDKLEPRWMHWITKTPDFWAKCDDKSRGTSGKNRIRPERFLEIQIPLPPIEEQRRIVQRIEELAAKVNEARALRQQAAEVAQALSLSYSNAVFSGKAIHRWPRRSLHEVSEIRSGVTLGRNLSGRTVRLPYLRVANVQDGYLDLSEIKEVDILESEIDKWQLLSGDLLLTEGGDWDKLGRGTVWREEIPGCIHQNHIFRVRTNPDHFVPEFLAALIGSPIGKAYFQEASKQTTNLASINQTQLRAFPVFQPPLSEQHRIIAQLNELHQELDALKTLQAETSKELDALMPSVLDKAFRGELLSKSASSAVPA